MNAPKKRMMLSFAPHPARDWLALLSLALFVGILLSLAALALFVGIETGTIFAPAATPAAPQGVTRAELDAVLSTYQSRAASTTALAAPLRDPSKP